jgi:hypothetical protein
MHTLEGADLVQLMGWKCVAGSQQLIEIVRPKVVANEREDSNPNVCFHPIPLQERLFGLSFGVQDVRQDNTW